MTSEICNRASSGVKKSFNELSEQMQQKVVNKYLTNCKSFNLYLVELIHNTSFLYIVFNDSNLFLVNYRFFDI